MSKATNQPTRRVASQRATPQTVVRRNWTVLLPAATALIVGIAVLTSIFLKGNTTLLPAPGQGHLHAALLLPDRVWVGAQDGLYERSSNASQIGWRRNSTIPATEVLGFLYQPTSPPRVFVAGDSIGVAVSEDGGISWRNLLPGKAAADNANEAHALAADPLTNDLYVWVAKKGILRSNDGGASWQPTGNDVGGQITALLARAINGQLILYAADVNGISRSIDKGATWQPLPTSPPNGIYALAGDAQHIYAGTARGLYQSRDSGQTWQIVVGLPTEAVIGVAIGPTTQQHVVVFNNARVYFSSDDAATWQQAKLAR